MKKRETVTAFDFENAFKALSELDIPKVDKKQSNLNEHITRSNVTNVLMEDYYDVNDFNDLAQAQNDRQKEIAQAKLARIEKIVDIDAESPEDILPSYVGKYIIQCPQCMTLFYKDQEDIEISEEDESVCNTSEICQHCGNDSGYTIIGKVEAVEEVEESQLEETPAEETEGQDEENLENEEVSEEENVEDQPVEVEDEENLNLEPTEEKEAVDESLQVSEESLNEAIDKELDDKLQAHNDYIEYLKDEIEKAEKELENAKNEFVKKSIEARLESLKTDLEEALPEALKDEVQDELPAANEIEEVKESLTENLKEESAKELLQDFADSLGEELKETIDEDFETEEKLAKFEQTLENVNKEENKEESLNAAIDSKPEPTSVSEECAKIQEEFVDDVSSEEFKELVYNPIYRESLEEEEFEELDECSLNEHISGYLNNVYENVKSFETTSCAFENNKLIVEGNINFNSGNINKSKFEFIKEGNSFVGKNSALCEGLSFTLGYKVENKVIITESFKYKYNIGENLVEGIIKK